MAQLHTPRIKAIGVEFGLLGLLAFALIVFHMFLPFLEIFDTSFRDSYRPLFYRPPSQDIVIIESKIDQHKQLNPTQLVTRLPEIVKKLSHAKAVYVTFPMIMEQFEDTARINWTDYAAPFKSVGNVVLERDIYYKNGDFFKEDEILPALVDASNIGVNCPLQYPDTLQRGFCLYFNDPARGKVHESSMQKLLRTGRDYDSARHPQAIANNLAFLHHKSVNPLDTNEILYAAKSGAFHTIGAFDVLSGQFPDGEFIGKYVLITTDILSGSQSYVPTSLGQRELMSDGEIVANYIDAYRSGYVVRFAPAFLVFVVYLVHTIALYALLRRRSPWKMALFGLLSLASVSVIQLGLLYFFRYWIFAGYLLVSTFLILAFSLAYHLWQAFTVLRIEARALRNSVTLSWFGDLGKDHGSIHTQDFRKDSFALDAIRRASEVIRHDYLLLSNLIDIIPYGLILAQPNEKILAVNRAARELLFGDEPYRADPNRPVLLRDVLDACEFSDANTVDSLHLAIRNAGDFATAVGIGTDQSRQQYWMQMKAVSLARQREVQMISFFDLSIFEEANFERDFLIKFVGHDLRSHLSNIVNICQAHPTTSRQGNSVDDSTFFKIRQQAQNAIEMTNQFMDYSTSALKLRDEFQPFIIQDCVVEAIEHFSFESSHKSVKVVLEAESVDRQHNIDFVYVFGVRNEIFRAITNLISNALQFSPQSEVIVISVRPVDAFVDIDIIDNGPGIDQAVLARLFDLRRIVSLRKGGFGFGLLSALTIAKKHGGSIRAQNRSEGGAQFTISLPIHDRE